MLLSMTGFGRGERIASDGSKIVVQVSSVNRKQLEMRFSMPSEFLPLETAGRKQVAAEISRGSVQVRCVRSHVGDDAGKLSVNTVLLDKLVRECRAARVRANLAPDVALETLMTVSGVVSTGDHNAEELDVSTVFFEALSDALRDFHEMRAAEGRELTEDLLARLDVLKKYHSELYGMTKAYPEMAKAKIMAKLESEKLPIDANDTAMMREVLFYVDKSDVTEELTRLESHFKQFTVFLESSVPSGRNLDFLAQEIFREITTLGNKAAGAGASALVVAFKAEMEKIREQIQNIE